MKFDRLLVLLGSLWCAFYLLISVLGGVIAVACSAPGACSDSGFRTARAWQQLAPWSILFFGAGVYFGFKSVGREAYQWLRRQRTSR